MFNKASIIFTLWMGEQGLRKLNDLSKAKAKKLATLMKN